MTSLCACKRLCSSWILSMTYVPKTVSLARIQLILFLRFDISLKYVYKFVSYVRIDITVIKSLLFQLSMVI